MASPDFQRRLNKLDGDINGLRTQFTEFLKKYRADQRQGDVPVEIVREVGACKQGLETLSQQMATHVQERASAEQSLRQDIASLKQDVSRLSEDHHDHKRNTQQNHSETHQRHSENRAEIKKLKGHVEDHIQKPTEGSASSAALNELSADLQKFKNIIYDSGILVPKLDPPEDLNDPPVGTLELGQDVFSARLLLKLGFSQGERERMEYDDPNFSEMDEDSDLPEKLVMGLQVPEIRPGEPGYIILTKGWLGICAFVQSLQLLALAMIFAYGLENGDACLSEKPSFWSWLMLHLSKAAGIVVVGCLMGGDVMDTVNFIMVEVLLEDSANFEMVMAAIARTLGILLTAVANSVIFIIATKPDGVWLYITAVGFVNDLSRAALQVAKSGVLGHHVAKQMAELNFQLFFIHQYPDWFLPVRRLAHIALFGFILGFAAYVFFLPVQICPADGSAPRNIFFHFLPEVPPVPPSLPEVVEQTR